VAEDSEGACASEGEEGASVLRPPPPPQTVEVFCRFLVEHKLLSSFVLL
jgi:hypothetical protein